MGNIDEIVVLTEAETLTVDSVDVGFMQGEVTVEKTVDTNPVDVDQVRSTLYFVPTKTTITLACTIAEASLINLKMAWNESSTIASTGSPLSTQTLPGGIVDELPIRTLEFTGTFIRPDETKVTRVISVFKAQNFAAVGHAMPVAGVALVPVTFTLLPDTTKADGEEFYTIVDTETA